jgi:hypothetical protein
MPDEHVRGRTSVKKEGASIPRRQTRIAALGILDRFETGAILCRHRYGLEVGEHSFNPCLVAASKTWFQAVNPQLREPTCKFCSGSPIQPTAGAAKSTGVLAISSSRLAMAEILRHETGVGRKGAQ